MWPRFAWAPRAAADNDWTLNDSYGLGMPKMPHRHGTGVAWNALEPARAVRMTSHHRPRSWPALASHSACGFEQLRAQRQGCPPTSGRVGCSRPKAVMLSLISRPPMTIWEPQAQMHRTARAAVRQETGRRARCRRPSKPPASRCAFGPTQTGEQSGLQALRIAGDSREESTPVAVSRRERISGKAVNGAGHGLRGETWRRVVDLV